MEKKSFFHEYRQRINQATEKAISPAVIAPLYSFIPPLSAAFAFPTQELFANQPDSLKALALASFAVMTITNGMMQYYVLKKHGFNASLSSTVLAETMDKRLAITFSLISGSIADPLFYGSWAIDVFTKENNWFWAALMTKNLVSGFFSIGLNLAVNHYGEDVVNLVRRKKA